jgi:hypothetical protein
MLVLCYALPLVAWIAFVYVQHHYGDRPTTHNWWALMTAIGVFELGKGIYGEIAPEYALTVALVTAFLAGGVVQIAWVRSFWVSEDADDLLATRTN